MYSYSCLCERSLRVWHNAFAVKFTMQKLEAQKRLPCLKLAGCSKTTHMGTILIWVLNYQRIFRIHHLMYFVLTTLLHCA